MNKPAPPLAQRKQPRSPPPPTGAPSRTINGRPGNNPSNPLITSGIIERPQRIVLYGVAKIGKTTLANLLPSGIFLDLEDGTANLNVQRIKLFDFISVRHTLSLDIFTPFKTTIIDSGTAVIPMIEQHVLETKRSEKGVRCNSIEDYGWGKGYKHVHDEFRLLLNDLDQHIVAGRHVCIIVHADATKTPNPSGPDWLRWEPAIQNHSTGNIRNLITQWTDHVLFMGYDLDVDKDGKAKGRQSRTLYPAETPTLLAGSRRLRTPLLITEGDETIWEKIINA